MSDYNIPESPLDFFTQGEASYHVVDQEQCGDNNFAMNLFIDLVGFEEDQILEDCGTLVFVSNGEKTFAIHSSGLGDFCSHGYTIEKVENK